MTSQVAAQGSTFGLVAHVRNEVPFEQTNHLGALGCISTLRLLTKNQCLTIVVCWCLIIIDNISIFYDILYGCIFSTGAPIVIIIDLWYIRSTDTCPEHTIHGAHSISQYTLYLLAFIRCFINQGEKSLWPTSDAFPLMERSQGGEAWLQFAHLIREVGIWGDGWWWLHHIVGVFII